MSVNKLFRKRLLEQRRIQHRRSLSKAKTCKIKQLKKHCIANLNSRLNISLSDKVKPKHLRQLYPTNPRKPLSQESHRVSDTSLKPAKLHRNSLYNTSVTAKNPPIFDYFDENDSRQEVQAFSRYCDSIMQRVSAKTGSLLSSGMDTRNPKPPISKSLAELSRSVSTFEYMKKYRSQHKCTQEISQDHVDDQLLLSAKKEASDAQSEPEARDKCADQNYLKYSTAPTHKKLTVHNSFRIGSL